MRLGRQIISSLLLLVVMMMLYLLTGCLDKVDEGPPLTTILNPAQNEVVSGAVPVVVTASDEKKVERIRVFIDGVEAFAADGDLATFTWDTQPYADNQDHHISAYAVDDDDNIGPSVITMVRVFAFAGSDTLPQLVTIRNPINGQVVSGIVNVAVTVDDDVNNPIDSVAFFIDGQREFTDLQPPYAFPWDVSPLIDGTQHTIFSIAYDRLGFDVASNVISVTVSTNNVVDIQPPTVSFVYPSPTVADSFSVGETISVVVDAEDNIAVDSVAFYIDGVFQGSDTTPPLYEFDWNTTGYTASIEHTIYVRAFDPSGNVGVALLGVALKNP